MKILVAFVVILISPFVTAQERKILHGQVVNDTVKVENVIIFNINAKAGTISKKDGFFNITARENDTLVFSSLSFKSKKIVVSKADFEKDVLKIPLRIYTNELLEVVVDKEKVKVPKINKQAAMDQKYYGDEKSSPKNTAMPNYNVIENGVDFVRMYKDVMKLLRKKNPKKSDFTSNVNFTEFVMNRISYSFFTNSLKLRDDQIKLFLVFSENDSKSQAITKKSTDFEIMDFLVTKNNEFKKITTPQK